MIGRPRNLAIVAALLLGMVVSVPDPSARAAEFPDRLALVQLLREGEFERLDTVIRNYQRAYEADAISEGHLEAAYFAFSNSSTDLERQLDRWVRDFPGSYPALMARGAYLWNLGLLIRGPRTSRPLSADHHREVRDHFSRAGHDLVNAIQDHRELGIAYSLLIHMASEFGDLEDVIELTRRGALADPRSVVVHRRYLESQRPWVAKGDVNEQFLLARIQRHLSNLEQRYAEYPDLGVLAGYSLLVEADRLVRQGERAAAITFYDAAAAHGYWVYLYRRGVNHFRLRSFDLALMDFDRALEMRPQAAEILNMRARALRALERPETADIAWNEALALNPRDPKILFYRAAAQRDDQDFEAAVDTLTVATELGRHSAYIWDARGRIYLYDLQQFVKAVSDLERTIAFAPASQRYWFNYATALYKKRDCEAVGALRYYLSLCETQSCPAESKQWTTAWSEALHASYKCRPPAPLAETQLRGE